VGETERYQVLLNVSDDPRIRERNCSQLLAADSPRVEEVHEHRFVLLLSPGQSAAQIGFPFDWIRHGFASFLRI